MFAPNSSPGEKIEGACMPCWALQGTIAVGGKVREYRTNYKLISTENKLKLRKETIKHQKQKTDVTNGFELVY
jgi:hypothetical protein